ncbi:HAMP domain-containing histidine kinase [Patescibacteria group bacterium]|nr:HAMP domain-containing histidine kinase [Patescibacteria group bacterium]
MKELQKNFKDLLGLETKARDMYSEMLQGISDKEIVKKLDFIRKQEVGHILFAKELIRISKKAEQRRAKPRIPKEALVQLEGDFVFKRYLLNTMIQLLEAKLHTFSLLNLLGRKNIEFKKAAKLRQDLMNTTIHQLKTPIAITNLVSELLLKQEKEKLTKEQKEMIGRVTTANKSMLALVNDLLGASKIEEGKGRLKREDKVDLLKILKEIINELDYSIKTNRQKINLQTFKKDIILLSNEDVLKKIIYNLLTNAIQYGRKGGKTLIVIKRKKPRKILISISDDGIGIPAEEKRYIFKKFYRASNAKQAYRKGTGLGLYLVRELLKKIGGKIWFESEEGEGTTFYVTLPFL